MSSQQEPRAVSPVVAVILLVAVTVTLSAVIGGFALNLGQSATSSTTQQELGVSTSQSDGTFTATVVTGSADEVVLLVNGTEVDNTSNASAGDTLSVSGVAADSSVTVVSVNDGSRSVVSTTMYTADNGGDSGTLTNGLFAHYQFDEGSGTTAVDSVNGYDGTIDGGAVWTSNAVSDKALVLDGTDDNVTYPHSVPGEGFSVFVWVNATSSGDYERFISTWDGAGGSGFSIEKHSSGDVLHTAVNINGTGYGADGSTSIAGEYHHVGLTYDGSTLRAYLDGTKVAENTNPSGPINDTSNIYSSRDPTSVSYVSLYNGTLDDLRFYNRTLNSSEVSDLYNATK